MVFQSDRGVVIVDAGGGTIDITAYSRVSNASNDEHQFDEIAPPRCVSLPII
jgi:hypothetical protein